LTKAQDCGIFVLTPINPYQQQQQQQQHNNNNNNNNTTTTNKKTKKLMHILRSSWFLSKISRDSLFGNQSWNIREFQRTNIT